MRKKSIIFLLLLFLIILLFSHGSSTAQTKGDLNSDGKVDISDVLLCAGMASGFDTPDPTLADMDGDNLVTSTDCNLILQVTVGLPLLPPDPSTVAPPVNGTVATTIAASTEFLYTGTNPIQTGVAPGTIEIKRAAVLRGKVLYRNGQPLPGVTITILNHPEFGQTLSRLDGMFDLAVNGGGQLTVNYNLSGFLNAQRQVQVPSQDYVWLSEVVLITADPQVSVINFSEPIQVARGRVVTDSDGTRQATLLFSQGTTAQMVLPDGSTKNLTSLSVRATEFSVGSNGAKAMPAELPPGVGYTYCVEFSADEAQAAGATNVVFSQPVYHYVENFLNFPAGGIVPVGYYDRQKGQWIASKNGRVIKILGITNGQADRDINGDGLADDSASLAALGITDSERAQLINLYPIGTGVWRVPIPHFSLKIAVAGRLLEEAFDPLPNQKRVFIWDGKDAYGRTIQGSVPVDTQIRYVYPASYGTPAEIDQSFGLFSGVRMSGNEARQEINMQQNWWTTLGPWDSRGQGPGGWTLSVNHAYDPIRRNIYRGGC